MGSRWDWRWFTPTALAAEWARQGLGGQLLRLASMLLVLMLCLSPHTIALAPYLDAIGIDGLFARVELHLGIGLLLAVRQVAPALPTLGRRVAQWLRRRPEVIGFWWSAWLEDGVAA